MKDSTSLAPGGASSTEPPYRYQKAREHIGHLVRGILGAGVDRGPEELLGYAHGCEDMAYKLHALSNRRRAADEEAQWAKLMAL